MENDVLTVSFVVNTIYGDIEFKRSTDCKTNSGIKEVRNGFRG